METTKPLTSCDELKRLHEELTKVQEAHKSETCPCCGYCKSCGRGENWYQPYWIQPRWQFYPAQTIYGGVSTATQTAFSYVVTNATTCQDLSTYIVK